MVEVEELLNEVCFWKMFLKKVTLFTKSGRKGELTSPVPPPSNEGPAGEMYRSRSSRKGPGAVHQLITHLPCRVMSRNFDIVSGRRIKATYGIDSF